MWNLCWIILLRLEEAIGVSSELWDGFQARNHAMVLQDFLKTMMHILVRKPLQCAKPSSKNARSHTSPALTCRPHIHCVLKGVVASGGDDCVICVWDLQQKPSKQVDSQESKRIKRAIPQELLFQHVGHRSMVVDFQWNPMEPWTMLSVSDDVSADSGGGTLQMWRINDLIYRPENEVLQELEQHRWVCPVQGIRLRCWKQQAANSVHSFWVDIWHVECN